ncbi:17007_t:CDS:2 [Acaulospora morrowiae]|uniref:17007_t:CDS:1 n=1 Tax=Acaulospora morrowiae TaxID=94023 RepID=A0A9N9AWB5_9GLOM|nr:17007_t:CDS:2 [Acaulospora morrowiae]
MRDSESSTSSVVGKIEKQLNIQSQEIIDEEMSDASNEEHIDNSGASSKAHNSKGKSINIAEGSNKRPIEAHRGDSNSHGLGLTYQ